MSRLFWPTLFEMDMAIKPEAPNVPSGKRAAALRWRNKPQLGLPRQPFRVFSRLKTFALPENQLAFYNANTTIPFPIVIEWGRTPLFEASIHISPNIGQTITVQALDHRLEVIAGESVQAARPNSSQPVPMI